MLAACIVRALISGECFIRVVKNAMFSSMQLLEYIKTAWCMPISTLSFAYFSKAGKRSRSSGKNASQRLSRELQNRTQVLNTGKALAAASGMLM